MSVPASDMAALSTDAARRAPKIESIILGRLRNVGYGITAEFIGIAANTFSDRVSAGWIAQIAKLLALCGLKVVPKEHLCVDRDRYLHLVDLAQIGLTAMKSADSLLWDDPE